MLTVECEGCHDEVATEEAGTLWCDSPLGMTTLKVHRSQECALAALEQHAGEGLRLRKGNRPPMSPGERAEGEGQG